MSDLYGRQNVAQIITFGTMASRAVIKDVGRSLEMPYSEVEKVAKMIPPPVRGRNVSIEDAIKQVPELKQLIDGNQQVAELVEIARKLEGCARHTSVHAAGVVQFPLGMVAQKAVDVLWRPVEQDADVVVAGGPGVAQERAGHFLE